MARHLDARRDTQSFGLAFEPTAQRPFAEDQQPRLQRRREFGESADGGDQILLRREARRAEDERCGLEAGTAVRSGDIILKDRLGDFGHRMARKDRPGLARSEEHPSELQSLMRHSYAVFCLKKKTNTDTHSKKRRKHI